MLQRDKTLRILAESPLMLSIMSLAYQNIAVESLAGQHFDTVETGRRQLFDTYIKRMFKRKGQRGLLYTPEETTTWLSWLAQQMKQHNQAIFLIEQLQPSWLPSRTWQRPSPMLTVHSG